MMLQGCILGAHCGTLRSVKHRMMLEKSCDGPAMRNLVRALAIAALLTACGDDDPDNPGSDAPPGDGADPCAGVAETGAFSFFISSTGGPTGGDFRLNATETDGLAGADAFCQTKAATADPDAGAKTWRAYLSTSVVDARDRIGPGPWYNRNGARIACSVAHLHDAGANSLNKTTALDENRTVVNGRGDTPNHHDILTGSNDDGIKSANHCNNWTRGDDTDPDPDPPVTAAVGHHDRMGGGQDPMSWNAAHVTNGCSADAFVATGGRGSIYCFAQ